MKIRHAEVEDVDEIRDVAMESWKDTYSGIIPLDIIEEIVESWYDEDDLIQQVDDPIFFVAEEGEEITGYIHASVKNSRAHLHRIYLRPESQGEGIGTELYKKAEKEINESGGDFIRLEVMSENTKGLDFYRGKGFIEEEEEEAELNETKVLQKVLVKKI